MPGMLQGAKAWENNYINDLSSKNGDTSMLQNCVCVSMFNICIIVYIYIAISKTLTIQ